MGCTKWFERHTWGPWHRFNNAIQLVDLCGIVPTKAYLRTEQKRVCTRCGLQQTKGT